MRNYPEEKGDTTEGRFRPSFGKTGDGKFLPAKTFLRSESCGYSGCHSDIFSQWRSSVHRLSSFNNPFYKKTVEVLEKEKGTFSTKFCGGCHDPVLLFSGKMENQIDPNLPESQAGITCLSCHGIQDILGVRGNAEYVINVPQKYPFADQEGPLSQFFHRLLIRVKPGPHRKAFLKTFHKESEFCGVCHKVSIDVPVNEYRWKRGQNEYDAWQMSAFSSEVAAPMGIQKGTRQKCNDCHMPRVESKDMGNQKGKIHDHSFAAANTALPHWFEDKGQLKKVEKFLKNNQITLDLIAIQKKIEKNPISPLGTSVSAVQREGLWKFPVSPENFGFSCGEEVIFEILVKNKGVGHSFPGGTIDAQEVWLEFQVSDGKEKKIFHSGFLEEDGQVDRSAHFFGAFLLNKNGEPILHRNIQDWVATANKRVIPPGGAGVVYYQVFIPENCQGPVYLKAGLHYRKFRQAFTQFVFQEKGERNPAMDSFPVVTLAEFQEQFFSLSGIKEANKQIAYSLQEVENLNAYGLALFSQRDFRRAEEVFQDLIKRDGKFLEGRARLVRVLLADGAIEEARQEVEKLLEMDPQSSKGIFLKALVEKEFGNYSEALRRLESLYPQFPNDREILKEMGLMHFLQERYDLSKTSFEKALSVDPEDQMPHYYLGLIFEALGEEKQAEYHRNSYLKYKESEEEETLASGFRRRNPITNREAQLIHIHD